MVAAHAARRIRVEIRVIIRFGLRHARPEDRATRLDCIRGPWLAGKGACADFGEASSTVARTEVVCIDPTWGHTVGYWYGRLEGSTARRERCPRPEDTR